jgi:hypothetical protein
MFEQMRLFAADLRASAARCEDHQHMEECLLLASRYEDLASSTEVFMRVLGTAKVLIKIPLLSRRDSSR